MKTLLLLRHAKAENPAPGSSDFDRTLTQPRGQGEARAVGIFIQKLDVKPDLVLSSNAARARETTALALRAAGLQSMVRYDQRIYEAEPLRLLEVISEIENDISIVLLVGHNPGMEELIRLLTGRSVSMATGTLAKVDIALDDWRSITEHNATLDWIVRPAEVAAS
jgi:phosphohistidine phosphatase